MKKILSIVMVSAVTLVLSAGCSSSGQQVAPKDDVKSALKDVSKDAVKIGNISTGANAKKSLKAIVSAGEETDWKITKFRRDMLIAEKTVDGKSASVMISFGHGKIIFDLDSSEIGSCTVYENEFKKAIMRELSKGYSDSGDKKAHH